MYTTKDIYNTIFSNTDRYYDSQIAADFHEVDGENLALLFFENLGKEYTHEEFKQVKALAKEFEEMVHANFNFWTYTEEETGAVITSAS